MDTKNFSKQSIMAVAVCSALALVAIYLAFFAPAGDIADKAINNKRHKKSETQKYEEVTYKRAEDLSLQKVAQSSEFYSDNFSQSFKDNYLLFRKGVVIYGLGVDSAKKKEYLGKALTGFAAIYASKDTAITDEEKSFAVDVMSAIYISSSWDDNLMIENAYAASPFKEMYAKNLAELGAKYSFLKDTKDNMNVNVNQPALVGAASQLTMSQADTAAYKLHPHGYPLLRAQMNEHASNRRIYMNDPSYKDLAPLERWRTFTKAHYTKEQYLSLKDTVAELDKKDLLYLRMRASSYEINMMQGPSMYDPLILFSTTKEEKLKYTKMMHDQFKKGSESVASLQGDARQNLYVMTNLFYVSFLVDYGITKKINNVLDKKTTEEYKSDALGIVRSLMLDYNQRPLQNYLSLGKEYSKKPANVAVDAEYYGGTPYYQLRVLAEEKGSEDIKEYLMKSGWDF